MVKMTTKGEMVSITKAVEPEKVEKRRFCNEITMRTMEGDDEYSLRMKKEADFLELQRELFRYMIGEEAARGIVDYYQAGLPTGIWESLVGKDTSEDILIERRVLGKPLTERMFSYLPENSSGKVVPKKLRKKYHEHGYRLFPDFNPDVLYICGNRVLMKNSLEPDERRELARRANDVLGVLDYSQEFYLHRNWLNPWEELIKKIEGISIRAEPMQDVKYAKTGIVRKWVKDHKYAMDGMIVETLGTEEFIILTNAKNQEKFGYLKGLAVRYHIIEYSEDGPYIYGDLISTSLAPCIKTPSLPAPKHG